MGMEGTWRIYGTCRELMAISSQKTFGTNFLEFTKISPPIQAAPSVTGMHRAAVDPVPAPGAIEGEGGETWDERRKRDGVGITLLEKEPHRVRGNILDMDIESEKRSLVEEHWEG